MSRACRRLWKCEKTVTFRSLLRRCVIPCACACHAKRHLNVQKWSKPVVFLTFWLRNVLRATPACTFSTWQLPKVVRTCGIFFHILTSTCPSRHNGMQLLISHLHRWLRTRRFSELTFWPSTAAKDSGKTQCFATFLPFRAPSSSFFWLFLFSDLLSSTPLFSDSSHLCFSSVHIVGSLTSKLPSIILYCIILYYIILYYIILYIYIYIFEGSLEVKLPTIWTVEKQRWEESEETRSEERRGRCAKR